MASDDPQKRLSVVEILEELHQGTTTVYLKLCAALEQVHRWQDATVVRFLTECVEASDLMNEGCNSLVKPIMAMDWYALSDDAVTVHSQLLVALAAKQVAHLKNVLQLLLNKFTVQHKAIAKCKPAVEAKDAQVVAEDEQVVAGPALDDNDNRVFLFAHRTIARIVQAFPMSTAPLMALVRTVFPFYKRPSVVEFHGFTRNLIVIARYIPELRLQIWSLLIDKLLEIDSYLERASTSHDANSNLLTDMISVFQMDVQKSGEEAAALEKQLELARTLAAKLDICMRDLFEFLRQLSAISDSAATGSGLSEVDAALRETFETHLLHTVDAPTVPFLWFYLCALQPALTERFLSWLWNCVTVEASSRKAQTAVCYMAGLVARAQFVDARCACSWLEEWLRWTAAYLAAAAVGGAAAGEEGAPRHGRFYAVCQAVFLVVGLRHRQLVSPINHLDRDDVRLQHALDEMRRWNLERLTHSPLNPLRYCTPSVAQHFASVCRCLQLVYCQHIIERNSRIATYEAMNATARPNPFEMFFPFESYSLPVSQCYIAPLLRPLEGGEVVVPTSNQHRKATTSMCSDADDFLVGSPAMHQTSNALTQEFTDNNIHLNLLADEPMLPAS